MLALVEENDELRSAVQEAVQDRHQAAEIGAMLLKQTQQQGQVLVRLAVSYPHSITTSTPKLPPLSPARKSIISMSN